MAKPKGRCGWCGEDPLYVDYHDKEWGVPIYESRALFEKLILDGFQAGLSWITILRKRDAFIEAFDQFDPQKIAKYDQKDVDRLLGNAGIVRHRGKIEATIANAKVFLEIEAEEPGGFSGFLWGFIGEKPLQPKPKNLKQIPAETDISKAMSKALKKKGFKFCGPTIVYAFMQAVGMVNDHVEGCFRQKQVAVLGKKGKAG